MKMVTDEMCGECSDIIDPELEELMPNFDSPADENPSEEEVDGPVFAQLQNFQNGDHIWMLLGVFLDGFNFIFAGLFAYGRLYGWKVVIVFVLYV
ncbi:transmembrane protein, putative [Medicago truncatula]|uniref:Transmembrane protein, putative n=2 Tax=Medicago truncatula TaxID=3880 RepID=G7JZK3_MEDTR|nr:transmembrane protein, putative [Medicago truncatula]